VAAVDDDDLLRTAADVDSAVREVAEVTRPQPSAGERVTRLLGIAEVACHHAGTADTKLTHVTLADRMSALTLVARGVLHLVMLERSSALNDLRDTLFRTRRGALGVPGAPELFCIDVIGHDAGAKPAERDGERRLGHPVAADERLLVESDPRELVGKSA